MGQWKLLVASLSNRDRSCTILLLMLAWRLLLSFQGSALWHLAHLASVVVCKVLFWAFCGFFSTDVLHASNSLLLLQGPLAVECLLLDMVLLFTARLLLIACCHLFWPLWLPLDISFSVVLVPAVADWVPGCFVWCCRCCNQWLWWSCGHAFFLTYPWTMFHLSMLCSASSSVDCAQGCGVSPQNPLLCRRVCGLLFFCHPQACPSELDIFGLACMLLCAWLCGVSPSILDCCMSKCRVGVSPMVLLVMSRWWAILLLWFLVACCGRQACSWVVFLCCSQVGSMFLPLLVVLLQTCLGVWLLVAHRGGLWSLVLSVLFLTVLVVKPSTHRTGSQSVGCSHWPCRPHLYP